MTITVIATTVVAALVAVAAVYGKRRVRGDSIRQTGEGKWEMEIE